MASLALGATGAGRLGITTGFEPKYTPGLIVRCGVTPTVPPADGVRAEPLTAQVTPGRADGGRAAGVLDAHLPGRRAVPVPRALPADTLDADPLLRRLRRPRTVGVAGTLNTGTVLIANLVRWAVAARAALTAGARRVGWATPGDGLDAERARRRTVAGDGALEAEVAKAPAVARTEARTVAVNAAEDAEAAIGPQVRAIDADVRVTIRIDRAQRRETTLLDVTAAAAAVGVSLPEVGLAVMTVVDAPVLLALLAFAAGLCQGAALIAAADGPEAPTAWLLLPLLLVALLLLGSGGQAEQTERPGEGGRQSASAGAGRRQGAG